MEQDTLSINGEKSTREDSSKLYQSEPIPDTPFTAIKMDDKWFLTMGKYRLTNPVDTYEDCIKYAYDTSWDRILQIVKIMIIEHENEKTTKPQ